jgi:molybdopterin synthase sulfur carrier subunit
VIRVRYFASLRERLGTADETLAEWPVTVGELRDRLAARGGAWAEAFAAGRPVLAAVNQDMAGPAQQIADGDEIGFFPPVTGG